MNDFGLVYYTDNRLDDTIARVCREQLDRIRGSAPVIAVSLAPLDWPRLMWGDELIRLPLERGALTMFRQILAGLEALDTEVAFLVEHDVIYHPSHFTFTPVRDDVVFYNQNVVKVRASDGYALHYRCSQTSGLCANRGLLVEHYRKRVAKVEKDGFTRKMGFEPGTHRRPERVDDLTSWTWMSPYPNLDIRHGDNITESRWTKAQFRNKKNTEGWTEIGTIQGWGVTKNRFPEFLRELSGVQVGV